MSALNSNNTFDGLDEPVRPTPEGRKRRLDKENHKKQQKKVLRWRVNTHPGSRPARCDGVDPGGGYINTRLVRQVYSMSP